jgi:Periplasmic binding protein
MEGRLRIGACLSLSGRFAQFGRQAAAGLQAWKSLDGTADVVIDDDRSDRQTLETLLPNVAARCDVLLGPYSTVLMRAAGRAAAESGWLIWNQGGSGDDVEHAHPGHVVSVLTPASRYAEPFLRYLTKEDEDEPRDLCIVEGPGSFGHQVADGAAAMALQFGLRTVRTLSTDFPSPGLPPEWDLFSAGVFEQDTHTVVRARRLPNPPRRTCTISAGVREFARHVIDPGGIFGIAQWFPGSGREVLLGPSEEDFVRTYAASVGARPDYPAAQAAAGAILAAHCVRLAGSTRHDDLWAAASSLDTSTLFGAFRIDPATGTQVKHDTVLIRWTDGEPAAFSGAEERNAELPAS